MIDQSLYTAHKRTCQSRDGALGNQPIRSFQLPEQPCAEMRGVTADRYRYDRPRRGYARNPRTR